MTYGRGGSEPPWEDAEHPEQIYRQQYPRDGLRQQNGRTVPPRRVQGPPQEPSWQQPAYPPQGYGQQYPPQGYQPGPWELPGYGHPPFPPQAPRRGGSWAGRHKVLTGLIAVGSLALVGGIAFAAGKSSSSSPPAASSRPAALPAAPSRESVPASPAVSASPAAPATLQIVTYVVTGSAAHVTYGPSGSDLTGTAPMSAASTLGDPPYYSIRAQLEGGGTVTCKLEVDGKVISVSTASGGYAIAVCEISRDPVTGQWENDSSA